MKTVTPGSATNNSVVVALGDVLVRTTVAAYLRECGVTVAEAKDTDEVFELISSGAFGAVFAELHIPGPMDGFSLAQRLRAKAPDTFVVLTANAERTPFDAQRLCQTYLRPLRPFNVFELARRLRALGRL